MKFFEIDKRFVLKIEDKHCLDAVQVAHYGNFQITKSDQKALANWFCSSDIATNRRFQELLNKAQRVYSASSFDVEGE